MKFAIALVLLVCVGCQSTSWQSELKNRLPVLGHRNFIVIADSAYPAQANPGITTLYTNQDHVSVIKKVLSSVESARHVNPVIYLDKELTDVPEADASGIGALRDQLDAVLNGKTIQRLPHMEIIKKLDKSAELFNVLILKTNGTLPYTSVFIELDCGYWNSAAEERLRAK